MVFRVDSRKMLILFSFLAAFILLNLADSIYMVRRANNLGRPHYGGPIFIILYGVLATWIGWWMVSKIGRSFAIGDTEIKEFNRFGKVIKSRRFDQISELKLGELLDAPRSHWMFFSDGKKWLIDPNCENFDTLIQLIEKRTGLSFVEPILTSKKTQRIL